MKKILTLLAVAAMVAVACGKDNDNNGSSDKAQIAIDGDFADWAALDASKVVVAKNAEGSPWEAVKEIRVYADKKFVYYYIKFDGETLRDILAESKGLPMRICLNTDGEFESGYDLYFKEHYDFIIEGELVDDNKEWTSFDGTFYQRLPKDDGTGTKWKSLLESGNGIASGAGKDNEYEIALSREVFNANATNSVEPKLIGDTFQTGLRFYYIVDDEDETWTELSNMPNLSIDESENGWGHLLEITTNK
jgi:hypothetical protein